MHNHTTKLWEMHIEIKKGVALSRDDTFTSALLPKMISTRNKTSQQGANNTLLTELNLEDVEKNHVMRVLDATGWHKGQACEILGVSRPRLRRMINQYELIPPDGSHEDDID